ncbi:hypothetical protein KZ820_07020 [Sphingomonas sp. RRHST34]|uniref:Uncharacterized protein n=1 Tax=Sphingomonas citri TaxID=2862499 RepID=A0ABS7BLT3_9SPHN|nr:hypothetical protein [Sphingomonas citri]MBW6530483.1 hypothetical protein [Sphingomonas citri]
MSTYMNKCQELDGWQVILGDRHWVLRSIGRRPQRPNDYLTAGLGHNSAGCAVCTAIDREGLVERLAEEPWENQRDDTQWTRRWADAGELWHIRFRELARTAIGFLSDEPLG